jgi:hypothetical protein
MKIILISLVIFFTICSKSWAGELDGKGLICKFAGPNNTTKATLDGYGETRYYAFHLSQAIRYSLNIFKTLIKVKNLGDYWPYDTEIAFQNIVINRKTLIHTFYNNYPAEGYDLEIFYQCEVSNKKEILSILNKIIKKSLEQNKREREKAREGNKI